MAVISLSAESRPSVSSTPVSMPMGSANEIANGKSSPISRRKAGVSSWPASQGPNRSWTTFGSATTNVKRPTAAAQVKRTLLKM